MDSLTGNTTNKIQMLTNRKNIPSDSKLTVINDQEGLYMLYFLPNLHQNANVVQSFMRHLSSSGGGHVDSRTLAPRYRAGRVDIFTTELRTRFTT